MQKQTTERLLTSEWGIEWRFRERPRPQSSPSAQVGWCPAQVPGFVHLDLMRIGALPHPYVDMQERSAQWVDECDWEYEATFWLPKKFSTLTYLQFDGLDTVAEIDLNGQRLGETDNMFIPHEFDVSALLRYGQEEAEKNKLNIRFRSALQVGRERQQAWNEAGNITLPTQWFSWGPRAFVRKAQYMYGWDWGPELVSCGIWKEVRLKFVPLARVLHRNYRVLSLSSSKVIVRFGATVERNPLHLEDPLDFVVRLSDWEEPLQAQAEVPTGQGVVEVAVEIVIESPRLWWPNGSASQQEKPSLYMAEWVLESGKELVDRACGQVGLRTVELIRQPDGQGESFGFRVNGRDMFMKGANWIPSSSFPGFSASEITSSKESVEADLAQVRRRLLDAADAGLNMLRVWGGGLYESEPFYELCDRLGLLVWQDFPYACSYYPDTGEYAEKAAWEATMAARRLRLHPSLAIWCGNNENQQMHYDGWVGRENRPSRLLGERLYNEVLPKVLAVEDPDRLYWPGSPYGGENPNSEEMGDRHNWNVWHGAGDWVHYKEDKGRFISEFGFASSCSLACWRRWLSDGMLWVHSPAVRWHDKTRKSYETYLQLIAKHFPLPRQLEELVYYSQLNQAEALRCGVEHWRRNKTRCRGTLFWQWNDCWPVQSWSVIDYMGIPKAAYYAIKRAYAPLLLSMDINGQEIVVWLVQDTNQPLQGHLVVQIQSFEGELLRNEEHTVSSPADTALEVVRIPLELSSLQRRTHYVWAQFKGDGGESAESILLLAEPKQLLLTDAGLQWQLEPQGNGWALHLQAERFAPYVWLRLEEPLRGHFSDNFFSLQPGERRSVLLVPEGAEPTESDVRRALTIRSL